VAASSINFRKQLTLPFPSLSTLGSRIDAARRAPDPVALAHAASELAVAEKVSGKHAALTSSALIKEAAEVARLRRKVAELEAVAQVNKQIAGEQNLAATLQKYIAEADAQAKARADSAKQNQNPTLDPRKVTVNNYTQQYLTIYVNGLLRTEMGPGATQTIVIDHHWKPTFLSAFGDEDNVWWGPHQIWGELPTYTWNITGFNTSGNIDQ
jgi:hypothetical protein